MLSNAILGDYSFELSDDEYSKLYEDVDNIVNGTVSNNLGCGYITSKLDFIDLNVIVNNIFDSDDSQYVGEQIVLSTDLSNSDNENYDNNRDTIVSNFLRRIINILTNKLLSIFTISPEVKTLFYIHEKNSSNGEFVTVSDVDYMKSVKVLIKCITKVIEKTISEFIFNKIKSELINLLKPITKKIIKEKNNQYIGIIKSLINVGV